MEWNWIQSNKIISNALIDHDRRLLGLMRFLGRVSFFPCSSDWNRPTYSKILLGSRGMQSCLCPRERGDRWMMEQLRRVGRLLSRGNRPFPAIGLISPDLILSLSLFHRPAKLLFSSLAQRAREFVWGSREVGLLRSSCTILQACRIDCCFFGRQIKIFHLVDFPGRAAGMIC
jgi:hypothetical protein